MKRQRVIGTTPEAICREENELGLALPPSFVAWLMENNGLSLGGVTVYPVRDDRDPRKTWNSINHNFRHAWKEWLETIEGENMDFTALLPFADYGTGDYYCFDYAQAASNGECPVVRWSHETGAIEPRAATFSEFADRIRNAEYKYD